MPADGADVGGTGIHAGRILLHKLVEVIRRRQLAWNKMLKLLITLATRVVFSRVHEGIWADPH